MIYSAGLKWDMVSLKISCQMFLVFGYLWESWGSKEVPLGDHPAIVAIARCWIAHWFARLWGAFSALSSGFDPLFSFQWDKQQVFLISNVPYSRPDQWVTIMESCSFRSKKIDPTDDSEAEWRGYGIIEMMLDAKICLWIPKQCKQNFDKRACCYEHFRQSSSN